MSDSKTKTDEHGEYKPDAGSPYPLTEEEAGYIPCNAVLRHTWERYGERRYCTALAVENFTKHGVDTDYEHPEFCRHHQSRYEIMKKHEDRLKTGAHAKSHEHLFQHLPPHKQVLANDLFKSLLSESTYDFDAETVELEVDVSRSDFAGPEVDTLVLDHPVPQDHKIRATALWFAALDFMSMESIREERFRVAAEEDHEGRSLAIGETTTYISSDDGFKEVADEHHLNLEMSRLTRNYKEHMKFGGVPFDAEDDVTSVGAREWVAVIEPDEPDVQPESKSSDSSPLHEVEIPEVDDDGDD